MFNTSMIAWEYLSSFLMQLFMSFYDFPYKTHRHRFWKALVRNLSKELHQPILKIIWKRCNCKALFWGVCCIVLFSVILNWIFHRQNNNNWHQNGNKTKENDKPSHVFQGILYSLTKVTRNRTFSGKAEFNINILWFEI